MAIGFTVSPDCPGVFGIVAGMIVKGGKGNEE
jgi:hypothetical protein